MDFKIIILYEPEQIDVVLSHFGKEALIAEDNFRIIALNYEVALALRQRRIPHHSLQEYITMDSFHDLNKHALQFGHRWLSVPEMDFFQHSGIRLGEVRRLDLINYIVPILYYLEVMSSILDSYSDITQLYIPQSSQFIPSTAGPIASFAYRIPVDIAILFGKIKGIPVSVLPFNKQQFNKERMLSLRRRIVTFLFEQGLHVVNFIITITRPRQGLKIFVIDHWRNIRPFMRKMNNVELVMMERKEIKKMGWQQVWKKRARFVHREDFITSNIRKIAHNKQIEFRSAWQVFGDKPKFSEIFCYQGISYWPVIKPVFDYIVTKHAEQMICEIESIKRLLSHFSINRVLLRSSSKDHFYLTAKLASQLKIPSIELQHGLLDSETALWCFAPVRVDCFAAYGKLTKEILIRNYSDPQRIFEVGSSRFDRYLTQKPDKQSIEVLRTHLNIDPSFPVILLIVPAMINLIRPWIYTSFDVVEIFRRFRKLQHEIKGLQIIVKLRPTSIQEKFYREAAAEIFKKNAIITQYQDLKPLLQLSNVVVSPNSTIILEAMIIGKPVILYTIRGGASQFQLFERAGALRIARNLDELFSQTHSLIFDKNAQEQLIKNARIFLEKNYRFDGKSSARIIKLLR